jgi:undecaprenyl-diphosphatase
MEQVAQFFFDNVFTSDFFINIDVAIYQFVESFTNPALTGVMKAITHLGDTPGIIWFVLGIILLIPRKTRKLGILMFAGLAFSSLINNVLLKELLERPRPFIFVEKFPEFWEKVGYEYPGCLIELSESQLAGKSPSFPSGHTSTSIGAAFALLLGCRKKQFIVGVPAFILSLAIGFSRIYVHIHYPTDVIGGAIVGLVAGVAIYFIFDKLVFKKAIPALENKIKKKIIE